MNWQRNGLDPTKGILFGLVLTVIAWSLLVVGFTTVVEWLTK